MRQTNTESVKKFREKMTADECARMEVTIGTGVIHEARELARQSRWPLWRVVETALMAYLKMDDAAETGNAK